MCGYSSGQLLVFELWDLDCGDVVIEGHRVTEEPTVLNVVLCVPV